ncbi:MAG: hypothetical protein AAF429_15080 [Pseudomonadota bacterium]
MNSKILTITLLGFVLNNGFAEAQAKKAVAIDGVKVAMLHTKSIYKDYRETVFVFIPSADRSWEDRISLAMAASKEWGCDFLELPVREYKKLSKQNDGEHSMSLLIAPVNC